MFSILYRMVVPSRVGKQEWVIAAYRALVQTGPVGVSVEVLARRMGLTKGSFYWHFTDRRELLDAALDMWAAEQTQSLIDEANRAEGPLARLKVLFERVTTAGGSSETAIYQAAAADPGGAVGRAATRVTGARIDYVAALLRDVGLSADDASSRAHMAVALVVGFRTLESAVPAFVLSDANRRRTTHLALTLLTTPPAQTS